MIKNIELRRKKILTMLSAYGTLNFQQLRDAFPGVSDVTLRKDLQYLNDTQQAVRTHGGIKSIPSVLNYFYRSNINPELKKIIAKKAVNLIKPGDSVFISAGTTCAQLASCLPNIPLRLCSDGIYTVSNIASLSNVSVEMLGGEVDLNIMRTSGIATFNELDGLHFSITFFGTVHVDENFGFGHNDAMTVAIQKKVIEQSDRTVILMDSTKFDSSFSSLYYLPFSLADTIVTDDRISPERLALLKSKGLEVI